LLIFDLTWSGGKPFCCVDVYTRSFI
jgi:hypothetical protein